MKILYDPARILAAAEAGARDTHSRLSHHGKGWVLLPDTEKQAVLDERVRRAREYAAWRIGSYEAGETVTPW